MSFRTLLLTFVLGLILLSTGTMGWLAVSTVTDTIPKLFKKQIEVTLDAVTDQIESLFDPSDRLLLSLNSRIQAGTLATSDPQALARNLADAIQFEHQIAWIGFGYPDGRFAGAWTDDGTIGTDKPAIGITLANPNNGPLEEWQIDPKGALTQIYRKDIDVSFDSRKRIWFRLARDKTGMIWTKPYDFLDKHRGISAAQAIRDADGRLVGIFTVDFLLDSMGKYLESLQTKFSSDALVSCDTLVLTKDGEILAQPQKLVAPGVVKEVRKILADPQELKKIESSKKGVVENIFSGGEQYMVGLRADSIPGNLDFVSVVIVDREYTFGSIDKTLHHSLLIACIAFLVSLVAGVILAGWIANPLKLIAGEVSRIGNFDLETRESPSSSIREVRVLSEAVVRMRSSLESFAHYVPIDLVRDLVRGGGVAALGGERREVSLMFCDLADFTSYAESVSPEIAYETLTTYFERFGKAIDLEGGVIDKFLGDGIMALFNAPDRMPRHAAASCRAALAGSFGVQQQNLPGTGKPFRVRVGLHCGEALIGNVGTISRFAYTAIGDCVNLCSRLEGLNKVYGTAIIASAAIREAAGDQDFLWRYLDRVVVVGRKEPLDIFELLNIKAQATAEQIRIAEIYPAALEACHRRAFKQAKLLLEPLVATDPASAQLLRRIDEFIETPVDESWDGVFDHHEK